MNKKFIFNKQSIILFILGVVILITGYIFMAAGDITISPILLVIAYVIVFPLSIMIGLFRKTTSNSTDQETEKP